MKICPLRSSLFSYIDIFQGHYPRTLNLGHVVELCVLAKYGNPDVRFCVGPDGSCPLMDANTSRDEEAALPVNPRTERSRTPVPPLLLISSFIVLYLLTSHNGDEFLARHHYQDALQTLTFHLSNYSAWMNGTSSNFSMVCSFQCLMMFI